MLSLTGQYALRALIFLAQHVDEWPIPGKRIAQETEIPAKYLSKVLGDLVRARILESSRGIGGGFRMKRTARQTLLIDVLAPFEQFDWPRCPFGNQECSEQNPCQAHDRWKKVIDMERGFLRMTSVFDVSAVKSSGRKKTRRRRSK